MKTLKHLGKVRRLVALPLLLLVYTLIAVGCKKNEEVEEKPVISVQAVHPRIDSITEEIAADATLAPVAQAAILPKIVAPVRTFYVQRGSTRGCGSPSGRPTWSRPKPLSTWTTP